jgi:DHA1 family multidrug resistance protein-like MFS transporter
MVEFCLSNKTMDRGSRKLRELYVIMLVSFLLWTGWMAFTPVFPLHVVDKGFSYFTLGILMAVPSVLSIFIRIPIGSAADRIGKKRVILFGLAMQSLSFILLGAFSSVASLLMVRILQGVAVSFVPPIVTVAIYDLAIPENKGKTFGVFFYIHWISHGFRSINH